MPIIGAFSPRHNLCPNGSFEHDAAGSAPALWVADGVTLAVATGGEVGSQCLECTGSGTASPAYAAVTTIPIVAGDNYAGSAWVKIPAALTASVYLSVQFFNASGGLVNSASSASVSVTSGWQELTVSGVAGATAVHANVLIVSNGTWASGQIVYVDAVILEQATTWGTYFDGDTAEDTTYLYTWDGTAGQSASTASPAPQPTVYTDANPSPRVEVDVLSGPADAVAITVWRNWGNQQTVVRGCLQAPFSSAFLVIDYEVPLGVPVTYACQTFDVNGTPSPVFPVSAPVTVASTSAWLSDPLAPATVVEVPLRQPAATVLKFASLRGVTYAADSSTVSVAGSNLPIGFARTRRLASKVPIEVRTTDAAAASALRALLLQVFPLCVRVPANLAPVLGGLAYLGLSDVTETLWPDGNNTTFQTSGDSIQPTMQAIVAPLRTWKTLQSEATSWAQVQSLYATWLDVQRGS